MQTQKYAITEHAGNWVAGRKVPQRADGDGNLVPQVGYVLELTDAEAKYPLQQMQIVPLDAQGGEKPRRAARDGAPNA